MEFLTDLWLAIVVSAVLVFFGSFVFWAATPWHNKDIKQLPDPGAFDRAVSGLNLPPGHYMVPCTHDAKEMKSAEFLARYNAGPWMTVNVFAGRPSMGRNLGATFVVFVITSALIAYVARAALADGAAYLSVFRVVGATAFLAYGFGGLSNAMVYALLTAGAFAWLWPGR
jgi:hypothetical protein